MADESAAPPYNFVPSAGPGCHLCHGAPSLVPWLVGWEDYDPRDYGLDEEEEENEEGEEGGGIPEIALDPDHLTVSVTNASADRRMCYVTVFDVPCRGRDGRSLLQGRTTVEAAEIEDAQAVTDGEDDGDGGDGGGNGGSERDGGEEAAISRRCTTFVVLCPPRTFVHLCTLDLPPGTALSDVEIDSDVREYVPHPDPADEHPAADLGFPLRRTMGHEEGGEEEGSEDDGGAGRGRRRRQLRGRGGEGFLCTQGEGGHLTHHLLGNHHAVDFRCPVGTPVVAVADGTVVQATDSCGITGIAVGNLFRWNSVMLRLDSHEDGDDGDGPPLYVEYVHIQRGSLLVGEGNRVRRGQELCRSGGVGFSPEPHLHFSAFRSEEPTAPTVRVRFRAEGGCGEDRLFLPRAGLRYDERGLVEGGEGDEEVGEAGRS